MNQVMNDISSSFLFVFFSVAFLSFTQCIPTVKPLGKKLKESTLRKTVYDDSKATTPVGVDGSFDVLATSINCFVTIELDEVNRTQRMNES